MTGIAKRPELKRNFSDASLFNGVYIPLFYNKNRFLHLYGSAGSGKSVFACQREIVESYEERRRGRVTLVVRRYHTTLKDSVYAELKHWISEWGLDRDFEVLKSPLSITNKVTNVQFVFRGLDDVEKIKSVRGVDRILIEEATEIDRLNDLTQLNLRMRGFDDAQITVCYNPVNVFHWLKTEIHDKALPGHFFFHTTYKDNRFLDEDYKAELESLAETNRNYYNIYVLGQWGQEVEGLIYERYETVPEFPDREVEENGIKRKEDDVQFYGLDFGYSDPCALVAGCVRDEMGDKPSYYVKELLYETKLDGPALVRRFDEIGVRKGVPIIADSARPEMIATLTQAGYYAMSSVKGAGSVLSGINEVRKYRIRIAAGSKNLIKEINNYSKREVNGVFQEEPVDHLNHAMDALRYGLQHVTRPGSGVMMEDDFSWL